MLIKGNILSLNNETYNLIDFKNRVFPVYFDGVNTHILNYENLQLIDSNILNSIPNIRFNFFNESPAEVIRVVNNYNKIFF